MNKKEKIKKNKKDSKYFEFKLFSIDGDKEFGMTITPDKKKRVKRCKTIGKNENDKKQMIKAEKGLFIGFIVIPMSFTLLIISLIGIYILNITTFELIIIIGFCIVLVIILRRSDNFRIKRKYNEV